MGTNFYGRIIPSKEKKEHLIKLIYDDNFKEIQNEVAKMYGSPESDSDTYVGGNIHLGKRSGGWKFLWNPNLYKVTNGHTEEEKIDLGRSRYKWVEDPYTVFKYYDLTKASIKSFIDRVDVEIYDEYGDKQDKEEFWNMALNWTTWIDHKSGKEVEAWDGKAYELHERDNNPNYHPYNYHTDYCTFLKEQGFAVFWPYTDFYSDGLRFSTSTYFS